MSHAIMDQSLQLQVDFRPLVRKRTELPVSMSDAQAVVLGDKVYIGGGNTFPMSTSTLFIYDFTKDSWDTLDTPIEGYALATYLSQLVLVGGMDPLTGLPTNNLWVLNNNNQWKQLTHPMPTSRWGATAVSVGEHLIVAGGFGDINSVDVVEVYDGHQWRRAQYLPRACYWMKSALHKGNWYLAGGMDQEKEVFCTSLKSLIATAQSVGADPTSVWNELPHAPFQFSSPVVFENQLITMGGGHRYTSAIHAYSHSTKSWVYAGDLPIVCNSTCTLLLPTGELLVVGGETYFGLSSLVFRANLRVSSSSDLDNHSDVSSLELAQDTEDFFSKPSLTGDISLALEEPLVLELNLKEQQTKTNCRDVSDVSVPDCQDMATQTDDEASAMVGTCIYHTGYLRGVDVIGETSLLVTSHCQTFNWAGYGMKLHIPKNSLPAKLKQCRLHIKVGLSGQFALPKDTSLVSAVYWLDSEPRCKFSKTITVEIQHCAKPVQSSGLSFVRAKCSQKDLPYTFKTLDGGVFTQQTNYGCISLNEFSILSVLRKVFVVDSYYCASFYYTGSKFQFWKVHFVVTAKLDACNAQAMCKHLKDAILGTGIQFEFEGDCVELDIPKEGIKKREWSITPLVPLVVTKQQVDNLVDSSASVWFPCLRLDWTGRDTQHRAVLCHQVTLQGAKKPFNYLTIESDPLPQQPPEVVSRTHDKGTPPGSSCKRPATEDGSPPVPKQPKYLHSKYPAGLDGEPDLSDLMNEVAAKIPSKWRDIGVQLGLDQGRLDAIALISPGNTNLCFSNVFTIWKNQRRHPYTWLRAVQALQSASVQENKLAAEIETSLTG